MCSVAQSMSHVDIKHNRKEIKQKMSGSPAEGELVTHSEGV